MVSIEHDLSSEKGQPQTWTAAGLPTLVSQAPQRPGLSHLLLFTSLFVPIVFLPYIPLRRHVRQQTRQLDALRTQLVHQISVTQESNRMLASAIHENQTLTREIQGLRAEFQKISSGFEGLREENKEKEIRHLAQTQWNQEMLGAIEKMQKETRPLTPETFKQLSETLAHLAAFIEAEERRYGLHGASDESSGVGVMRALAMRFLSVSGVEPPTAEAKKEHRQYDSNTRTHRPT